MTDRLTAVDTSVVIALLVASHEEHVRASEWAEGRDLRIAGHALVETYAVLTRLPGDARVIPDDAVRLIDERFPEPLTLPAGSARAAHRELAGAGIAGGATYDALVALAAREHGAVLATRDARARSTYERVGVAVEIVG